MVYLEDESYAIIPYLVTDPKIIKLFKIEARKKGADAIIIARMDYLYGRRLWMPSKS